LRLVALFGVIVAALVAASSTSAISFQPYQAYSTGSWPIAVAIGDVTSDGRNDILLTTSEYFDPDNDFKLFFFKQDQNGLLAPPLRLTTDRMAGPARGR
jgi:hypothetical protein